MIVWGSKGKVDQIGTKEFFCPACDQTRTGLHKRIGKYFTLYFIPIFKTSDLDEFIECANCGKQYQMEILNYKPPTPGEQIVQQIRLELQSGMPVHMIFNRLAGRGLSKETAMQVIAIANHSQPLMVCRPCDMHYGNSIGRCSNCGASTVDIEKHPRPSS